MGSFKLDNVNKGQAAKANYAKYMERQGYPAGTTAPDTSNGYSWDWLFGSKPASSNGLGTYGTFTNNNGVSVNVNEDAFNSIKGTDHGGTLTQNTSGFFGTDGFGMDDALGLGKLATGLGNLYLANKQLGLAEDTFKFNKADRNRVYAANAKKYNNALARTNAVNAHYNVANTGSAI